MQCFINQSKINEINIKKLMHIGLFMFFSVKSGMHTKIIRGTPEYSRATTQIAHDVLKASILQQF